ncbi:MAG: NUDIX hydrolase, partial [Pusillimonas sp.]
DARREAAALAGNSAHTNDINQTDGSYLAKSALGNATGAGDQVLHHTPNKTATTSTAEAWAPDAHLRPHPLVGVSAHSAQDLAAARTLNADFAVLGHVLETPSHVGEPGMGWERFASLVKGSGLPVFAIGGQSGATLAVAREHGAHGIAGMRGLLNFLR